MKYSWGNLLLPTLSSNQNVIDCQVIGKDNTLSYKRKMFRDYDDTALIKRYLYKDTRILC